MELQASLPTFLTLSKTKSLKPEAFQTRIPFTKELSFAKTIRYMLMVMKMTLHIFTICKQKPGPRNEKR